MNSDQVNANRSLFFAKDGRPYPKELMGIGEVRSPEVRPVQDSPCQGGPAQLCPEEVSQGQNAKQAEQIWSALER
ncbi:protein of unknown function [Bradyrhizobium vignae]|uniref:Uncharacterized protein n=1 Tax=Bradyrhizobium vignae TaxID=1549949 RepID=A0A2U3PVP8_9BRAD|nr:protein of unknown function [Bradyrhizobium vignae]